MIDRPRAQVPEATSAENTVTALLAVVLVAGVYTDGWAHLTVGGLDTFFSPWHAMLYGAFSLLTLWLAVMVVRRRGAAGRWRGSVPRGYGWGLGGIVVFVLAGLSDMAWHQLLGVETGVDALVSPPHLMLLMGGVLLVTSPLRAARPQDTAGGYQVYPRVAVISLAAATALAAFFLSYLSVFADPAARAPFTSLPEGAPGHREAEMAVLVGLGSYLVSTLLLVVPLLYLRRRARLPHSAVTIMVAAVAVPAAAMTEMVFAAPAVAALAAAALVDLIVTVRPHLADTVLAGPVPALVWAAQLLALAFEEGLRWPLQLSAGVVALTVLLATTLTYLSRPSVAADDRSHTNVMPAV